MEETMGYMLEEKKEKRSLAQRAGKWLAGFFIVMILLTVLSRAADAMTLPKVKTGKSKYQELNIKMEGSGTIVNHSKRYIKINQGQRIQNLFVKKGDTIKKGDLLFQFDTDELIQKLKEKEEEIRKAKIQLEKAELNSSKQTADSVADRSKLLYERAVLDLEDARQALADAESEYQKTLEKIEEKKKKQESSEKEKKKEVYEETQKNKEEVQISNTNGIRSAKRSVASAKEELNGLMSGKSELPDMLKEHYDTVDHNKTAADKVLEQKIFELYYTRDGYKSHVKEMKDTKTSLDRAERDIVILKERWERTLAQEREKIERCTEYDEYVSAQNSYEIMLLNRDNEVINAERGISDTKDTLSDLESKDTDIKNAVIVYKASLKKDDTAMEGAYQGLLKVLNLKESTDQNAVNAARKRLEIAEEDLILKEKECERLLEQAEEKVTKALEDLKKETEPYDSEAEQKSAEQLVKSAEKTVENAERSLEDARISMEADEKDQKIAGGNQFIDDTISDLDLEVSRQEIRSLQEEAFELQKIIDNEGRVTSPYKGTVIQMDLVERKVTTGEEVVALGSNEYVFEAKVSKEDAKRIAVDDRIFLTAGDISNIKTVVDSIDVPDEEGNVLITASIPEDMEKIRQLDATFQILKKTKSETCVPIQALKSDQKGKFVLTVQERETILGKELFAVRVDVQVLDQNNEYAAISSAINDTDQIIVGYDRAVEADDRVRVQNDE